MPAYDKSPFKPTLQLLIPGQNTYLWGSWPQDKSPSKFAVATVAIATDVATVTGTMTEGEIPLVGSLISIRGVQTAGGFNVTNVALASVTFTAATSAISVTFALTHADVAATPDSGLAIIPQPEVGEAIAAVASVACTQQNNETFLQAGRQISTVVEFPTLPTAVTVTLQGADFDQDSEYTAIGVAATVAASAQTTAIALQWGPQNYRFYRFVNSALTGTGKIIARITG